MNKENTFLNKMKQDTNFTTTENGATTHRSTLNKVLDMFAMGGAYRNRSDEDCILLFKEAFEEDQQLAVRCLFYLRDIRGGQGERRFFRVCYKWLACHYPGIAEKNLSLVPEYGRWDDLIYALADTPLMCKALGIIRGQFHLDMTCKAPSLLGKWLPSENASSKETKRMGNIVRQYLGMSHKEYRQALSSLRGKINVLEKLMSAGRWDEIEFDKIPSRAGLIYKNAFARRDIIAKKYETFAKSSDTKVNAGALYPHEVAQKAIRAHWLPYDATDRLMIQKYWDNLPDYYCGRQENGIAVVDVSGSMIGTPLEAAVSLGAYIADKSHGPFANHFITFSECPHLVEFSGVDITDKFRRCKDADWGMNTNLKAVFDLLLKTAREKKVRKEDMPERLYIFSDMEFDSCLIGIHTKDKALTLVERVRREWKEEGYKLPQVIFWNLDARQNNIPAIGDGFSYVSGFSPSMIDLILSGKDGIDLMLETLNRERYAEIRV